MSNNIVCDAHFFVSLHCSMGLLVYLLEVYVHDLENIARQCRWTAGDEVKRKLFNNCEFLHVSTDKTTF